MRVAPELASEYPGLRVLELELRDLRVRRSDPELETRKVAAFDTARRVRAGLEGIKDEPSFKAYRDFYWKVGIDPTKIRPAAEAITRRVQAGKALPTINTLVDVDNLVSLETGVAIAAFDTREVGPTALTMRRARAGEEFLGIGHDRPMTLAGNEVVIDEVERGELVALYPYRDADRSHITEATRGALLLMCGVPGIEDRALERARALCATWVREYCAGSR